MLRASGKFLPLSAHMIRTADKGCLQLRSGCGVQYQYGGGTSFSIGRVKTSESSGHRYQSCARTLFPRRESQTLKVVYHPIDR
jgi:hypothetical protein